jgi:hypothetical protein
MTGQGITRAEALTHAVRLARLSEDPCTAAERADVVRRATMWASIASLLESEREGYQFARCPHQKIVSFNDGTWMHTNTDRCDRMGVGS